MKAFILLFFVLLFSSASVCAQGYLFRMHRFYGAELFGIELKKPKGFKVVDGLTIFRVNEKEPVAMWYPMALTSSAKDCLILFPYFDMTSINNIAARHMPYHEIKAALGVKSNSKLAASDTVRYVRVVAKANMEEYCNADTVFIFKSRLPKPYKGIYSEFIGINTIKWGHPSTMTKILLTEEGKKKEEEYIDLFFDSMHYGTTVPEYSKERRDKVVKKMKRRFFFRRNRKQFLTY